MRWHEEYDPPLWRHRGPYDVRTAVWQSPCCILEEVAMPSTHNRVTQLIFWRGIWRETPLWRNYGPRKTIADMNHNTHDQRTCISFRPSAHSCIGFLARHGRPFDESLLVLTNPGRPSKYWSRKIFVWFISCAKCPKVKFQCEILLSVNLSIHETFDSVAYRSRRQN